MKGLVGIVVGAFCAIVIACAARQAAPMQVPPPSTNSGGAPPQMAPRPSDPRADDIDRLFAQIDQSRRDAKLPEQHGEVQSGNAHAMSTTAGSAPVAPPATCDQPKGQSDTCKQSCTLKDSICENAKKICDIAGEMDGDRWAAQKCADGNATCDAARKQCCECMP